MSNTISILEYWISTYINLRLLQSNQLFWISNFMISYTVHIRPYLLTYVYLLHTIHTLPIYLLHTIVSEHTHCAAEIPSIKIGSKVVDSEAPRLSAGGCVLSSLLSSFFTSRILGTLFVHIPSSHRHTSTYRKVGCEFNIGK